MKQKIKKGLDDLKSKIEGFDFSANIDLVKEIQLKLETLETLLKNRMQIMKLQREVMWLRIAIVFLCGVIVVGTFYINNLVGLIVK